MENKKVNINEINSFISTLTKQEQEAIYKLGDTTLKDNLKYKAQKQEELQKSFGEFLKSRK